MGNANEFLIETLTMGNCVLNIPELLSLPALICAIYLCMPLKCVAKY